MNRPSSSMACHDSGLICYAFSATDRREESAYAGQFQAETRLDADMLAKVMQHVLPSPKSNRRT